MKYFFCIFLFTLYINVVIGQEKRFVFIQSDNHQPFYVSLKGKNYSSSSSGYVIIPKLTDGDYNLSIGFAKNTFPEQGFTISINNKDAGYNLKNLGDKGWGLFNLQTLSVTMATTGTTNTDVAANPEQASTTDDDFVISFNKKKKEPAKDTAVATAEVKADKDARPTPPIAKATETENKTTTDTVAISKATVNTAADTIVSKNTPKKEDVPATASTGNNVKKVSETKGAEGVYLSYVDSAGKRTDTIQVIIPSTASEVTDAATPTVAAAKPNVSTPNIEVAEEKPATASKPKKKKTSEPKFLDINVTAPEQEKAQAPVAKQSETVTKPTETYTIMPNSNCKNVANDDDYAKLRKKMAEQTTDEKMISEAKKVYRNKCFTTSQIKGLSTLFLSDEGRFKFFDASFVSVADSSEYPTLQSEFIDPTFVARFKALLQ